jgi:hypothetical protein
VEAAIKAEHARVNTMVAHQARLNSDVARRISEGVGEVEKRIHNTHFDLAQAHVRAPPPSLSLLLSCALSLTLALVGSIAVT